MFDRLSSSVEKVVSKGFFFCSCFMLVVIWFFSGPFLKFSDTWQLIINTSTTIVTFLLMALIQNTSKRSSTSVETKLNALAQGVLDLMEGNPSEDDRDRLMNAIGLEKRVSSNQEPE